MIKGISEKLTKFLISKKIISYYDMEIYAYGSYVFLVILLNLLSAIFISMIFKTTWYCVIFIICFFILRKYAGGFHLGNVVICTICTQLIVCLCACMITYVQTPFLAYCLLMDCVCYLVIVCKAPKTSIYHPLTEKQYKKYKYCSRVIATIYFITAIIAYICNLYRYMHLFSLCLLIQSLLILLPERKHRE